MISVKSKEFSRKLLNRQKGFSILELLIVIGILGITSAFIYPSIGQWKIKRNIERDFQAVVSTIDYLKTRTRSVNGTSILRCDDGTGDMVMSYVISSQRNDAGGPGGGAPWTIHGGFVPNIIEDPSAADPNFNVITGDVNVTCPVAETLFNASGNAGSVGGGSSLTIEINFMRDDGVVDYANFNAYRVLLNTATAYAQKFKFNIATDDWVELN
jgi:prepilin-type N-terminal cleavage/methylation domain-containing protein